MKMKSIQFLLAMLGFTTALHADETMNPTISPQPEQVEMAEQPKTIKAETTPLDVELELTAGGTTTLADLMQENKAILVDFWATWCGPCIESIPGLKHKAEILAPQGVAVVAINIEKDGKNKAEKMRIKRQITFPWLVDNKRFYADYFQVESIPRAILISSEGEVLFNGHPEDTKALQLALNKLGIKL